MMSSSGERTDWSYSTAAVPTLSKNGQKKYDNDGESQIWENSVAGARKARC